jgi:steroid delta-isomerase-like uncharacterized protein
MDNKQLVKRIFEEAWARGNVNVVDELVAPDSKNHDPYTQMFGTGSAALKNQIQTYRKAFSDLTMTVDAQLAEGEFVVTRWTSGGTHDGDLMGNAPTNKKGSVTGITISRVRNGKIVETWNQWDMLGMFQQLGIQPQGGKSVTGRAHEERRA